VRKRIGDYLDGELDFPQGRRLEEHIRKCPDCRELLEDFREIARRAKELTTPSPSDKAWERIMAGVRASRREERVRPEPKKSWVPQLLALPAARFALSAALVLAVVAGGLYLARQPKDKKIPQGSAEQFVFAKLEEAEHYYQQAIRALSEAVTARQKGVNPQLAEALQANLTSIDRTIEVCQQAVQQNPRNLEVRNYLLAAYMEKVDILNRLMNVSQEPASARKAAPSL
jgi:anti-sigma factor RsiW